MSRRRMIDPSLWESQQVSDLTDFEFRVWIGLISHADDDGRLKANPIVLLAKIFPLKEISLDEIRDAVQGLEKCGLIAVYDDEREVYISHPKWDRWQTINRPRKSPLPDLPKNYEDLRSQVIKYGYRLFID